jgi:hypothetical protein
MIITDVTLVVNNSDLSDHVRRITTTTSRQQIDVTPMNATVAQYAPGIAKGMIAVLFFQDFDSLKVDQTLRPLLSSTTTFPVDVSTPDGLELSMLSSQMFGYTPVDGGVGDVAMAPVAFFGEIIDGGSYGMGLFGGGSYGN